jgi:hypothetical protein
MNAHPHRPNNAIEWIEAGLIRLVVLGCRDRNQRLRLQPLTPNPSSGAFMKQATRITRIDTHRPCIVDVEIDDFSAQEGFYWAPIAAADAPNLRAPDQRLGRSRTFRDNDPQKPISWLRNLLMSLGIVYLCFVVAVVGFNLVRSHVKAQPAPADVFTQRSKVTT